MLKVLGKRPRPSSWKARAKAVLKRDNYVCVQCWQLGRVELAREVDHIMPFAEGGTDDWDNLQSLCYLCHQAKTRACTREEVIASMPRRPARLRMLEPKLKPK